MLVVISAPTELVLPSVGVVRQVQGRVEGSLFHHFMQIYWPLCAHECILAYLEVKSSAAVFAVEEEKC